MVDLLTTAQAAEYLRDTRGLDYATRTIAGWCARGAIECIKPGHDWLIERAALDSFVPLKSGPKAAQGVAEREEG